MSSAAPTDGLHRPEAAARRVLVIGFGSPIRGDDAMGPIVADRLAEEELPPGVRVVSRHVLTPELVGEVAEADLVVFLDASEEGPAGEVQHRQLEPVAQATMTMGHFLDPREMLAWSRDLYDHEPTAYLVSVRGETFEFSSYELSPGVEAAIDAILERVRTLIGV